MTNPHVVDTQEWWALEHATAALAKSRLKLAEKLLKIQDKNNKKAHRNTFKAKMPNLGNIKYKENQ